MVQEVDRGGAWGSPPGAQSSPGPAWIAGISTRGEGGGRKANPYWRAGDREETRPGLVVHMGTRGWFLKNVLMSNLGRFVGGQGANRRKDEGVGERGDLTGGKILEDRGGLPMLRPAGGVIWGLRS